MGWLASGGTDFAYRMSIPVANLTAAGRRQVQAKFPGPFLRSKGKIVQSAYQDVHVTKSDGTTELPVSLDTDNRQLLIDYEAMPQGRTTLYVYYGHATALAPQAVWFEQGESGGIPVDNGCEDGAQGAAPSAVWSTDGAPVTKIYDHLAHPRTRSKMEMKLTGTSAAEWVSLYEQVSAMNVNGAEIRFWVCFSETNTYKGVFDQMPGTASLRAFTLFWNPSGKVQVYTDRSATGYTTGGSVDVATYAINEWWEYRLVFNFTAKTYTLSRRNASTSAWTPLKSATAPTYNIPMSGSGTPVYGGASFRCYQNANMWFDNLQYAPGGIADTQTLWTLQHQAPASGEMASEADPTRRVYVWGADLDATYLNSASASLYYGAATAHNAGVTTAGAKYHYLLKFFEGSLPRGTVSAAALHLYLQANTNIAEATTLSTHRFKTSAQTGGDFFTDWDAYVRAGWSVQQTKSRPTWTNRFYSFMQTADIPWQAAGGTGTDEIDPSEAASLVLSPGFTAGYAEITLDPSWVSDWLGDTYSQGLLIKDATDVAGAANRYVPITAPSQVNSPVLEVVYSALAADQLASRKVSTDTYSFATFPPNCRYVVIPDPLNGFAVLVWINPDLAFSIAYVTPEGEIWRIETDTKPAAGALTYSDPGWGIYYDASDGRFWLAGGDSTGKLSLAYSAPYVGGGAGTWTWVTHPTLAATKNQIVVKSGVVHILCAVATNLGLKYIKFTQATGLWSTAVQVANSDPGGTMRALASSHNILLGDVLAGAGDLWLNGAVTDYPPSGSVVIDSEYFWYTGQDAGSNKLTGVTRGFLGSAAAAHAVGATVTVDRGNLTYGAIAQDPAGTFVHCTYTINSRCVTPVMGYAAVGYLRHYFADADTVWKDEAGSVLTLPVDQRNERICSPVGDCVVGISSLVASNGDLVIPMLRRADLTTPGASAGVMYTALLIARLVHGESSFRLLDAARNLYEPVLVDVGTGHLVLTGIAEDGLSTARLDSLDSGATWGATVPIATHTFPAGLSYYLWCSAASLIPFSTNVSLMYSQHFTQHGAVYVDGLSLIQTFVLTRKILLDLMADGWLRGRPALPVEACASIARRILLPFAVERTVSISRSVGLPFETMAGLKRRLNLPVEWDGDRRLVVSVSMPLETWSRLAFPRGPTDAGAFPFESMSGVLVRRPSLPFETRQGLARRLRLPMEAAGLHILTRRLHLPVETTQRLLRKLGLPLEAAGLEGVFVDTWDVYRKLSEIFVDDWDVIPIRASGMEFLDTWDVLGASGMDFLDTWRVLPPEIVTLWGDDIQLPSATVEKT